MFFFFVALEIPVFSLCDNVNGEQEIDRSTKDALKYILSNVKVDFFFLLSQYVE